MGRSIDFISTLLKSHSISDDVLRSSAMAKSFFFASWLLFDSIQWLNAMKVTEISPLLVNKNTARLWLLGIISSLLGNLYKIHDNKIQSMLAEKEDQSKVKALKW